MKKWLLSFAFVLVLSGCVDNGLDLPFTGLFPAGTWEITEYQENGFTLSHRNQLPQNTYGYIFQTNGRLVNRSINGFCGTPPITTEDYPGTWEWTGTSLLLHMRFWGGTSTQEWKITQTTPSTVTLKILQSKYTYDFD
jgi:hypothetical protein